jgi:hypothetical protein
MAATLDRASRVPCPLCGSPIQKATAMLDRSHFVAQSLRQPAGQGVELKGDVAISIVDPELARTQTS